MGAKKILPEYRLIIDGVMSGTSTIASIPTNTSNLDNIALQIDWTGTPTGTITVQCSVDNVTFYALTFNPAIAQPAGSAGGYLISLNQLPYPWMKVSYTNASGSGVLNARIFGKDVN